MSEISRPVADLVSPELIAGQVDELAQNIRLFSESQVEQWQQLPYLALLSDGVTGYGHFNSKLYEYGLLHITGEAVGLYGTFVDCESGNILNQAGKLELDRLAPNADIVKAWLPSGQKFNAEQWLTRYQRTAVEPHKSYMGDERQVRQWRHDTAQRLGLLSTFRRVQLAT